MLVKDLRKILDQYDDELPVWFLDSLSAGSTYFTVRHVTTWRNPHDGTTALLFTDVAPRDPTETPV